MMVDLSGESKIWEWLALFVLLIVLFWMGPANIWDKEIDHGYPYGFYAQDAFIFMSYQYYLEESGSWSRLAPSLSRGFNDVIQSQPPVLEILSALLAQLTGFSFATATYVMVMLLVFLTVFCMYFIIRSFNSKVALLSLPLNVLLFSNVFITAFTWGNWPFFAGSAMFVLFLWCISNLKQRWIPALGALAMGAVAFGHTSEYLFIVPLLGFMFLVDTASKAFRWAEWKRIAGMTLGSVIIAGYYLIIFVHTFLHDYQPQYLTPESTGLSQFVAVTTPGLFFALMISAGALIGLLMVRKHRVLQIGLVMLLIGFTNYIGIGKRGLETRYLWPVYLSVFFGLFIYVVLTNVLRQKASLRTCTFVSIVFTVLLANHAYTELNGPGLLFKEGWQAMEWVAQSTPQNASVLYVYGDAYSQAAVLFNTQRRSDVVLVEDYVAMAREGKLRRTVQTEKLFDHTNALPYRTGIFTFGFHQLEENVSARGPADLCSFDYYVFDKVSRVEGAAQYNLAIVQHLEQQAAKFTKAYENTGVIVLRNMHPGGDCLGE
jgi:hypothetical protein